MTFNIENYEIEIDFLRETLERKEFELQKKIGENIKLRVLIDELNRKLLKLHEE